MATKEQVEVFISTLSKLAINEYTTRKKNGTKWVLPSVCIAQAALETGWGSSNIMTKANAYFGIKAGTNWTGKVYNTKTKECYDGVTFTEIEDCFRAYDSLSDSVKDYYDLITGLSRYNAACNVSDARTCIQAIVDGGYATDPNYVIQIMSIINANNLTRYDKETELPSNAPVVEVKENLWQKTYNLMMAETDYLEKASNAYLDSKSANAGYNNYTKYSRDVNNMGLMGCQGQPWCSTYQFWICCQIFGKEKALDIMGKGFYNCNSVKTHAKAKGTWSTTPVIGALVIFRNGAHIGRVTNLNDYICTNEGNTSASSSSNNLEANGGCVANKKYTRSYGSIDGYVVIDYGTSTSKPVSTEKWVAKTTATSNVDNLYVRAEPNGEILGELMKGDRFEVNGETSGNWTKVKVANIGVAWIYSKYIKYDTPNPNTVITNKQDKDQVLRTGTVTASALNVRTWAGAEFPKIRSYPVLYKGETVEIMNYTQKDSNGEKWYFVRIEGSIYGFVHSKYVS